MKKSPFEPLIKTWRTRRLKAGKTQRDLAYQVDVHEFTLSRWETGALQPKAENVMAVERELTSLGQPHPHFNEIMTGTYVEPEDEEIDELAEACG